jgi:hypothetical protein
MSTRAELENEVAALRQRILDRERADVEAALAAEEKAKADAAERVARAQEAVRATELEKARQSAWKLHRFDEQARENPHAPVNFDKIFDPIPTDGSWPPGASPDTVHISLAPAIAVADSGAEGTTLHNLLTEIRERHDRVKSAS